VTSVELADWVDGVHVWVFVYHTDTEDTKLAQSYHSRKGVIAC
jgi:hypothetical protein